MDPDADTVNPSSSREVLAPNDNDTDHVQPVNARTPRTSAASNSTTSGSDSEPRYAREYATFFAPRTHKFETVEFRVAASKVNLDKYFPKTAKERRRSNQLAAALGIVVGIVIGVIGFLIDQLLRAITLAIYIPTDYFLNFRTRHSFFAAVCTYSLLCCVAVVLSALLVVLVAPLGAGSGIPELKAYLNGVHVPGYLRISTLFVKAVGVALSIGGGLICGKQGPMIHTGAIVGAGLSQGASSQFRFRMVRPFQNTLRFLRTEAWKRDFTAVGAAIGVAVAFGAPMGGWVWVYEEACTHWTWSLGLITLGGCLSGAITVGFLTFLAKGMPNGGFSKYVITSFGRLYYPPSTMVFPLSDVPMYIVIGILGGIVGILLPVINKQITLFRYRKVTLRPNRVAEAFIICFLTAVLRIAIPKIANQCIPVDPSFTKALDGDFDYSQFNCPDGQHNIWAATFYNPTSSIVRALLYAENNSVFPAGPLIAAFFVFYFFIIWTYGVAVPAGVFFPGFVIGCVYGRLCGVIMYNIFPNKDNISMTGYAFLGAVSALAGITRTISVAIVALEAVAKGEAFFGSIIVALIAKVVSDKIYSLGIYDLHIDLKGMPFLTEFVPDLKAYNMVRMSDIMEPNVVGIRQNCTISEILHLLRTTSHSSYPVVLKLRNRKRRGYLLHKTNATDAPDRENKYSRSTSEEEDEPNLGPAFHEKESSLIVPDDQGFEATTYQNDEQVRVVRLSQNGRVTVGPEADGTGTEGDEVSTYSGRTPVNLLRQADRDNGESPVRSDQSSVVSPDAQNFGVTGMITRDILLAVLEHLLDLKVTNSKDIEQVVEREKFDSAWPNAHRYKKEGDILDTVEQTLVQNFVVDLDPYVDPDPLLISSTALATEGYTLLRTTGARHMLVTNLAFGRVVGICTRKDVLPESIRDHLSKLKEAKVQ